MTEALADPWRICPQRRPLPTGETVESSCDAQGEGCGAGKERRRSADVVWAFKLGDVRGVLGRWSVGAHLALYQDKRLTFAFRIHLADPDAVKRASLSEHNQRCTSDHTVLEQKGGNDRWSYVPWARRPSDIKMDEVLGTGGWRAVADLDVDLLNCSWKKCPLLRSNESLRMLQDGGWFVQPRLVMRS